MRHKILLTLTVLSAFLMIACDTEIPLKELTNAKQSIEKAHSVKADIYSPDEFKAAQEELTKAHTLLIMDEKPKDSVKSATESNKKAMEAYDKAVVLYAKDILKKADEAIGVAEVVYAEKLSSENFNQAKEIYLAANEKYEAKDYLKTIELADDAYNKALKAREESLENKYKLQVKIDNVKATLEKIEQYDYKNYSEEKYAIASENITKAQEAYDAESLKSGFEFAELAGISADGAYKEVMDGYTAAKIAEAEDVVSKADKSEGAVSAEADLVASKEALENARSLKAEENYDKSIIYSDEAIRLANDVLQEKDAPIKEEDTSTVATSTVVADDESDKAFDYYTVRSWSEYKDCLWKISKKYYNNPRLWKKIYKANENRIKNPNIIRPGWVIKVPKTKN